MTGGSGLTWPWDIAGHFDNIRGPHTTLDQAMSKRGKRYSFGSEAYKQMKARIANSNELPPEDFLRKVGIDKDAWRRCKNAFESTAGERRSDYRLSIDNLCEMVKKLSLPLSVFPEETQVALRARVLSADPPSGRQRPPLTPSGLADELFRAERTAVVAQNLLDDVRPTADDEEEGVVLIKPGGTFYRPCLIDLFFRILACCRIVQLRLYDGENVDKRQLFDQQYRQPTMIANGKTTLTAHDFSNIRECYDTPDFKREFGVPYDDSLVEPALCLCNRLVLDSEELTRLWNLGRTQKLNWNRQFDGLNKIGYQKTVFPIDFRPHGDQTRIVLNGYIPGYRALFVNPRARTVAIHVAADSWRDVREKLVGASSNPDKCAHGSIRNDALRGLVPLDPDDNIVNGQRNVCHCSATLLDGMHELTIWFALTPSQTRVGQICRESGVPVGDVVKFVEQRLSEFSATRDDTLDSLIYELKRRRVTDDHSAPYCRELRSKYAAELRLRQEQTSLIDCVPSRDFIKNGARYELAGHGYYSRQASKPLRNLASVDLRRLFDEVTEEILALHIDCVDRNALIAEALRIAANDLRLLQLSVYKDAVASPELFRSQVIAELPVQAIESAARTERNFIRDVQAYVAQEVRPRDVVKIAETAAWHAFIKDHRELDRQTSSVICLVLCGGRSTRMGSTIPKPALPYGETLMLDSMAQKLRRVIAVEDGSQPVYAAIGFRGGLLRRAFGNRVEYIEYAKTEGVGFRVATCLWDLRAHSGPVILSYVDTPRLPAGRIRQLYESVMRQKDAERSFGILTSPAISRVSGHVFRDERAQICEIKQDRTDLHATQQHQERDAGLYVFHNTEELRDTLLDVRNNNVRGEFMFADLVALLYARGWTIVEMQVDPEEAIGINTASDLLCAVSGIDQGVTTNAADIRGSLYSSYELDIDSSLADTATLGTLLRNHHGPLYHFHWWDKEWS